jgi:hypothetical protein
MNGKKATALLSTVIALGILGTTSAAWSTFDGRHRRGGWVVPCSLDGVNPVYHPDVFGDPAVARSYYGFIRSPDGTWHVEANCQRGPFHN